MVPQPHVIRLRQPWEVVPAATSVGPTCAALRRWFHRPTGLDHQTRLELVIDRLPQLTAVYLNAQKIIGERFESGHWRGTIPTDLPLRNELQVEITLQSPAELAVVQSDVLAQGHIYLEITTASPRPDCV